MLNALGASDSVIYNLVLQEITRQQAGLVMIPSENYATLDILETLGTPLNNKYSEGYPRKRYYSGNLFIDEIEQLAIDRLKALFGFEHANVQPHSGSGANQAVFTALLEPGDKILSMDLNAGGHITHGNKFNFSGRYYNVFHYGVNRETELIDYDDLAEVAQKEKPKLIISGTTSYPRAIDFAKVTSIAHAAGALHLADISHIAGLIVADLHPSCVSADIVTSTTHKTLRGPRGAVILCKAEFAGKIDKAVFPGLQGGPMENVIAAKAVCFNNAKKPEFQTYQEQLVRNAKILEQVFRNNDVRLVSGGTDNHLLLLDVSSIGITGRQASDALEEVGIFCNKNVIPFETGTALDPSGLRIGTPALTSRGMKEQEMAQIGGWIVQILKAHESHQLKQRVVEQVRALAEHFPIYQEYSNG